MASFNAAGQLQVADEAPVLETEVTEVPQITAPSDAAPTMNGDDALTSTIIGQLGKCATGKDVEKVEAWIEGHATQDLSPGLLTLCTARRSVLENE